MINLSFVLIIKLFLFFGIVIGFTIYNVVKINKQNKKNEEDFPPWHSDCPDNWLKLEGRCKNPKTGSLVNFEKETSNMTEKEKKQYLCLWAKENEVSWIGIDNSC